MILLIVPMIALALWLLARERGRLADTLPAAGGGYVTLLDSDATYTLVLFWSADCGPSLDDLRTLQEQAGALMTAHDLRIVTVMKGGDEVPEWVTLPVALDADGFYSEAVGVGVTPLTVIVTQDGRAVTQKSGSPADFWHLMALARMGLDYGGKGLSTPSPGKPLESDTGLLEETK
jgi:hypothetical protein